MGIKLSDVRDPKQRALFAKAAGIAPIKPWGSFTLPEVKQESPLERLFLELWTAVGGEPLEREVGLIPGRLFKVDFLHRASKTVIEIEGYGIGHFGKAGFKKDADKYFALQVQLGYTVIRLTKSLLTESNVRELIRICGGGK